MLSWMVVYPRGDRSKLDIAQVRDYEKSDWDLASRQEFDSESECREYMEELGQRHGLRYSGGRAYLD